MRKLLSAVLLAVLFIAGTAVYAEKTKSAKSSGTSKELTPAQTAEKCREYADYLNSKAAEAENSGKKDKAELYKKLADAKTKMAEAYEKNDTQAIQAANAEWTELTAKYKDKKADSKKLEDKKAEDKKAEDKKYKEKKEKKHKEKKSKKSKKSKDSEE